MICPNRGWCPTVYIWGEERIKFVQEMCETDEHTKCTTYLGNFFDKPQGCLCERGCLNDECFRHSKSTSFIKTPGNYHFCICTGCTYCFLCFPVVVAKGEEEEFVDSLSSENLDRLKLWFKSYLVITRGNAEPIRRFVTAIQKRERVKT